MVNKVILIGNVGMDPEVRSLENGTKVARIRLATTERMFDRQANETREHTEWHTVTLWRGMADVVDRYVRKGSQLYVEGRLRTREWTDREGNKRFSTEIEAVNINLLGRRNDNNGNNSNNHGEGGYNRPNNNYDRPNNNYDRNNGGNYYGNGGGYRNENRQSQPMNQTNETVAEPEEADDLPF